MIFDAKRPVLINGIGEIADRSDLIDRAVRLTLPTIPEDRRRTENDIWSSFNVARPAILGAFLTATTVALRNQADVRFTRLPRMADFARWVIAAEPACPWARGSFLDVLDDQRRDADEFVIEASLVANAIRTWVDRHGDLEGTATEILQQLAEEQDEKVLTQPGWPKGAQVFGTRLREVAPNLRRIGIEVDVDRSGSRRIMRIRCAEKSSQTPSSVSPPSLDASETAAAHSAPGSSSLARDSVRSFDDNDRPIADTDNATQNNSKRNK